MRPHALLPSLLLLPGLGPFISAPRASAPQELHPGHSTVVLRDSHPLSDLTDQARRMGVPLKELRERHPDGGEYHLEEESFELFVPERESPPEGFGLFVWISPGDSGWTRPDWYPVLAERGFVVVGANRSGNERFSVDRSRLALDAVTSLGHLLAIDAERVYAAGFSGGGRMASRLCIHYPEVFHAGIYAGACNFYETIEVPDGGGKVWPAQLKKPSGQALQAVKKDVRHVHLIGTEDFNFVQSRCIFERMVEKEKFEHVTFLEVPGLDHSIPDASWLEKALDAMDAPLFEARAKKAELERRRAERAEKRKKDEKDGGDDGR